MLEYIVSGNVLVRVGENAKDNDHLTNTSDPKHWWMHASGYPGAHVIVCYEGEELPRDIKKEAAALAIRHSKTPESRMAWVDVTRVENVTFMKQHGRVELNGRVDQVTVFRRCPSQNNTVRVHHRFSDRLYSNKG